MLVLAALVAVPCVLITGSRLVGGSARSPIPELAAFAPWAVIGWVLVLLLLLSSRWWWIAAAVVLLLAVQVSWVLPTPGARAAAGPRPGSVPLRVMTVNVWKGQADVADLVRLASENDVDLLAVQESLPDLVSGLTAGLERQLPHHVYSSPGLANGTVVWSRWPISTLGPSVGEGGQISRMLLQVPGAVPVTVTAVHTMSPGRHRIAGWNRDLAALTGLASRTTGAQFMLGDFNATRDHGAFRRILAAGLVDAAETVRTPPWRGVTWPAHLGPVPAAVRLDHVLVTPDSIGVEAVRVLTVLATDHRGILADLQVAGSSH